MRHVKHYILIVSIALLARHAQAQQTIQFSQYVFNGLALNPAYAGYKDYLTLNLSSRIQWVGFPGAPKTGTASIDGLLNTTDKNVGLGLIATFDQLGPETTSSVYANYAYRLRLDALDTKRLCFGIGLGVIQYRLNGDVFSATDAGDANIPAGTQSNLTPDFRLGVYYYSPHIYAGASLFNVLSGLNTNLVDNMQLIRQVRTAYFTAGAMLPLSDYIDIKPSAMLKSDFKGPGNLDVGAYLVFNKTVWLGSSYRTSVPVWSNSDLQSGLSTDDAVAAILQINVNDHFRIGYSFDFTTSKLASYQSGSHELSLSIGFPGKKQRVVSPRYF
ncbi:type IX secretion system PorP/SprF family membrane protein [Mucilaginibacter gracilis]|uniref:Type IX secretion system PorP/SprF family membrane protein n=1 Tax=Mucilaginibacter gracilis TaxID=423350 RepID=A0A495J7F3_9SPHI|nr:type IX secretion system membrane protein PorP/SprF [Mucilaginibacter gracilis]RKR84532.1 type IX secretion system PorP/SprF family membrane protein [Mucilaginibacter gracilis]